MGAKAPEKLKLRRPSCKCDVCGRKFLNTQALSSHRTYVHKSDVVITKRVLIKKPAELLQDGKVAKKNVANPPNLKKGGQMPSSKVTNKNGSKIINEVVSVKKVTPKKVEFQCPKCVKVFSVYFSALRHIEKFHSTDNSNQSISSDSEDIILPIRVELCDTCKKFFPASEKHICEEKEENTDCCMCLGCQKTFDNVLLFEQHVKGLHTNRMDCLFFANNSEFTTWKTELEAVTKTEFVISGTPPPTANMQTYHCSYKPPIQTDKALLCPSILTTKKINNGYRVIYYKEHFGHSCLDLPPLKYKKCSILPFLKDIDIQNIDGDEHVYQQFKSIMNNIIDRAAKVDISLVHSLLEKALAMTVDLNKVGQDDQTIANKSMTDKQITEELSEVKTYPSKRRSETMKRDAKQIKLDIENNDNSKTNSTKAIVKKVVETLPSTPLMTTFVQSSPSFNDTYKDFVDQNFKSEFKGSDSASKRNAIKKKVVVKTKIGQFKAKSSVSPPQDKSPSPTPLKVKPSLSPKRQLTSSPKTVKLTETPKSAPSPKITRSKPTSIKLIARPKPTASPKLTKPESSPKITKPALSPKITKPASSPKITKPALSPKITKPASSPKITKPASSPKITKPTPKPVKIEHKIKPDFKYEVREQENDCNILILKI